MASELRLTLTYRNRCIECPDASKTIGNQLRMKKYIGAVLRKSSQLELVAEIGPFENPLPAHKNQRRKLTFKKNKTISSILDLLLTSVWLLPSCRDCQKTFNYPLIILKKRVVFSI